ncbi:MAG: hypothetical protein KDK60_01300 [Chlamydiia bacterium]|nr:hypothetical protein [Chlamydiia bacterium]
MKSRSIASVKAVHRALVHFFYPTYCLHCDGNVAAGHHLLCFDCFSLIEWIDPKKRCRDCFGPKEGGKCLTCKKEPQQFGPHRSLFEPIGPLLPLKKELRRAKRGEPFASLIAYTLSKTDWPLPDVIVPLTDPEVLGRSPSFLIGEGLEKILKIPCIPASEKIEDKTVLFLVEQITCRETFAEKREEVECYFPEEVYSIALFDER